MPGEVEADEDSAEGMGDEMDAGAVLQGFMGEGGGDGVEGEGIDGCGAGRVVDVCHVVAFGFEGAGEGLHAATGPGESVEEDHAFLSLGEWRHAEEEGGECDDDGSHRVPPFRLGHPDPDPWGWTGGIRLGGHPWGQAPSQFPAHRETGVNLGEPVP